MFYNFLKVTLLIVLFFTTFFTVNSFFFKAEEEQTKKIVGSDIPASFPILVVTQDFANKNYKVDIIYFSKLPNFKKENPNYSFLVPQGYDDKLNKELHHKSQLYDYNKGEYWNAAFKVERLKNGKQFLEVEYDEDDDRKNIGWYEATEKDVFPKYHKSYFGPGLSLGILPKSFAITALIWVVGFLIYNILYSWWTR